MRRGREHVQLISILILLHGAIIILASHHSRSTEYIVDGKVTMVVQLEFDTGSQHRHIVGCSVASSRGAIAKKMPNMEFSNTHVMNDKSVELAAKACEHISSFKKTNDDSFTFPGTKWCGPGNTAENFNDLGTHHSADSCCRMHDFCPQTIQPGKTNFGLINTSPGIISHCDCDERLSKCLRANRDRVSDIIGIMFFDMLQMQCFKQERQTEKCDKSNEESKKCQRQEQNSTHARRYQLFSAKPYKNTRHH